MERVAQDRQAKEFFLAPILLVHPGVQSVPVLEKTAGFRDGERNRRRVQNFFR